MQVLHLLVPPQRIGSSPCRLLEQAGALGSGWSDGECLLREYERLHRGAEGSGAFGGLPERISRPRGQRVGVGADRRRSQAST